MTSARQPQTRVQTTGPSHRSVPSQVPPEQMPLRAEALIAEHYRSALHQDEGSARTVTDPERYPKGHSIRDQGSE